MANFTGDNGSNTIVGTSVSDQISGLGGIDTLDGAGGADVIIGGSGADILTGGTGADSFRDTAANFNGDRITDFLIGDRIQITDLTAANSNLHIEGSNLVYNGGSIQIDNLGPGRLVLREITGGGIEVRLQEAAHNDFNGDGFSDILWRNDNGTVTDWLGGTNGGFTANNGNLFASVPTDWKVAATGDFNGDGREDILWRHDGGVLTDWLGNGSGGFTANSANLFATVPIDWKVAGTGDFNGDGKSDILWRHDGGALTNWLGTSNGGFVANDANVLASVPTDWKVVGTGDFNGDGLSDVLWRHDGGALTNWLGTPTGGFVANDANVLATVPLEWKVVGTGDFNGDGLTDILWRHDTGYITDWLGTSTGGFVTNDANALAGVPLDWQVVGTGDYNGDAIDDILWRQDTGQVTDWLGKPNGGFLDNFANAGASMPTVWHEADPFH